LGITGIADSTRILFRQMRNTEEETGLTTAKPNIVIILMESMSSALLGKGYTPVLDSLKTQSLYFSNFYSAGIHTNHGMTATLYSFPALMKRNLMKGTVTPKRDGLPTVLKQNGWHNLFFMTHEAQYDNMNAFFRTNGYDEIYAQEDYPREEIVNSFGVSDHFLFDFALEKLNKIQDIPFMATLLTISNHPPYIIPDWFKPTSKDPETQIVEYADWCIGDFLHKAQREPWYANTVFVVLADHGKLVGTADSELPQSYNHIPLMIFGAGIQPQEYTQLGMQVDVMPTLLNIIGLDYDYNGFGTDLLHQPRQMVFYSADNQIVARDSARCFLYHPQMKKSFCYDIGDDGRLIQTNDEQPFGALRRYVFAMEQTAEYLFRR
jgi:phosphoglycerol transferase MdoB-like AlkP superfamily enzyme